MSSVAAVHLLPRQPASQPNLARVAVPHLVLCLRAHPLLKHDSSAAQALMCRRHLPGGTRGTEGDRFIFGNLVSNRTLTLHTCILRCPCWPIAPLCLRHVTEQWDDLLLHLTRV